MVYRGKPSKSCRQCRKRDIKCDKRKDFCGQCLRANLSCPGYHDQSVILFEDETKAVVLKAQVRVRLHTTAPPGKLLLPCLEDRAKDLFVSQYVLGEAPTFPYMESFWLSQPQHILLTVVVRVVSLAYLSIVLGSPDILQRARQRYCSALLLTNEALKSPHTAKENATLLAVMLLDLFEQLTQYVKYLSLADTSTHLNGALTLLQLAGPSQLSDSIRVRMFHQLSQRILLRCLKQEVDVPPNLLSLHYSMAVRNHDWQIEDVIIRFLSLRARARNGDIREGEADIESDLLDEDLAQICVIRPPTWKFFDAIRGRVSSETLVTSLMKAYVIPEKARSVP